MQAITERHFDHSGGVQSATNWLLRAQNEVEDIVNGDFTNEIGSIARRLGYVASGSVLVANKPGLGLYEAKFSTGAKVFGASNNSGDTATTVQSRDNSTGNWSALSLPSALPANTTVQMCDSLDEMYIAGKASNGTRIALVNVKKDLSCSATRNLIGAPKARYVTEFGGSLYAINVEVGGVVYPDRAYKSSPALGVITYTRGEQWTTTNTLAIDTARYLKAGMSIDIYNHVTGTARYTNLTIASVDKSADAIVLPEISGGLSFATSAVNTSTSVITLSSTTNYPTGTPVTFTSTTTLPSGLTAGIVYYVINTSSTTIKLATSAALATAGTSLSLGTTGTGTLSIHLTYYVADNDEIWLTGRYGELAYLWNTDYPSTDKADYLKLPSGAAANSEIIGFGKSNNHLFFFTDTTMHRWDKSQLITLYEDIGCASHDTIRNIGDWMIWLDSEGRVNALNDKTGQQEFISKAVYRKYMKGLPLANLNSASAGKLNNVYKLCLGTVNGKVMRLCYDFDSNNWTREEHSVTMRQHIVSNLSGAKKIYFLGDNGKFYQDEVGDTDDGAEIPFRVRFGRNNSNTSLKKAYTGFYFYGQNISSGQVSVYLDGRKDPIQLSELVDGVSAIPVGQKPVAGRYISVEITIATKGDAPIVEGYEMYATVEENGFSGR